MDRQYQFITVSGYLEDGAIRVNITIIVDPDVIFVPPKFIVERSNCKKNLPFCIITVRD